LLQTIFKPNYTDTDELKNFKQNEPEDINENSTKYYDAKEITTKKNTKYNFNKISPLP
jgi:hypothetical protein